MNFALCLKEPPKDSVFGIPQRLLKCVPYDFKLPQPRESFESCPFGACHWALNVFAKWQKFATKKTTCDLPKIKKIKPGQNHLFQVKIWQNFTNKCLEQ